MSNCGCSADSYNQRICSSKRLALSLGLHLNGGVVAAAGVSGKRSIVGKWSPTLLLAPARPAYLCPPRPPRASVSSRHGQTSRKHRRAATCVCPQGTTAQVRTAAPPSVETPRCWRFRRRRAGYGGRALAEPAGGAARPDPCWRHPPAPRHAGLAAITPSVISSNQRPQLTLRHGRTAARGPT